MKKIPETRLSSTGFNPGYQRELQILFYNSNISLKAKGLFLLIGDTPLEDRSFKYLLECAKESNTAIQSGIKELENAGLLYRLKCKKDNKFYRDYWLCWPIPFTKLEEQHKRELKELGLILDGKGGLIHEKN
jgi:hypothetical protein